MLEAMGDVVRGLAAFPYPTIALVQGRCLGGGLEVALACGQVIAEHAAIFAAAEIRLGVFAPAATAFLQSGVPRAVAEDILLSGRDFTAERSTALRLVSQLVVDGQLDETLQGLVDRPLPAAIGRIAARRHGHAARHLERGVQRTPRRAGANLPDRPAESARRQRGHPRLRREAQPGMEERLMASNVDQLVARAEALALDMDLTGVNAWKEADPDAARDRLPAGVRPDRDHHRGGHAPGRHRRRHRPGRDHPRRRLLPVLHLPYPAQRRRTRPLRPPGCVRRLPVPVHLRRHSQHVRHLEARVSGQVREVRRRAAELRPGDRRQLVASRADVAAR